MFKKIIIFFIFALLVAPPPSVNNNMLILAQTKFGTLSLQKIMLFSIFILLIIKAFKEKKIPKPNWFDIYIYIFLLLMVAYIDQNISQTVFFIECMGAAFIVGRYFYMHFKENCLHIFVKIGQLVGLIESVTGIISAINKPVFPQIPNTELFAYKPVDGIANAFRATGLTGHPITLGAVLIVGLTCFLFDKNLNKIYKITSILAILFTIILTFSRGAWIDALIIFAIWCFSENQLKKLLSFSALTILSILILNFIFPNTFYLISERINMTSQSDLSISHRSDMIYWSINQWLTSPISFLIGHGASISDLFLIDPVSGPFSVVDNEFLSMTVEYGLLGLIYMVISGIGIPLLGLKRINKLENKNKYFFMAISISVMSIAIYGFEFDFMYNEQIAILYSIFLGILSSLTLKPIKVKKKSYDISKLKQSSLF